MLQEAAYKRPYIAAVCKQKEMQAYQCFVKKVETE